MERPSSREVTVTNGITNGFFSGGDPEIGHFLQLSNYLYLLKVSF